MTTTFDRFGAGRGIGLRRPATGLLRRRGGRPAGDTRRTAPAARRPTPPPAARRSATRRPATARRRAGVGLDRRSNAAPRSGAAENAAPRTGGTKGAASRRRRSGPPVRVPVTAGGERVAGPLVAVVLALTVFGLVMVLSASSVSSLHQYGGSPLSQFKRQAMWAGLGGVAFVLASRLDYHRLRRLARPGLVVTIGLLVAVLVPGIGVEANGSTRWLGVGPLVFQPAEIAKLAVILFCADLLARRRGHVNRPALTVRPVMVVLAVVSALLILQPKLGTPIILGAVVLLMLFASGVRIAHLLPWGAAAAGIAFAFALTAPYRRARLLSFLDPWADPLGSGMQVLQSQIGIASGGLLGVGLGASRAKWGFLPYAHTDFIFAVVAEETGLLGAGALIGLFVLLGVFGFRAALRAPDSFGTLLAAGITTWLLIQAFLNIGMALGVMPVTGEPLPFVSFGGSSLVAALAGAGVLTSVARQART
jgi:cell division protein FtsW